MVLFTVLSCSPAKRPADEPDGAGTDTDTETETDTGLVWIPGDDFDLTEPFLFYAYEFFYHRKIHPALGFDGENLSVAWSNKHMDYDGGEFATIFFTFPWDRPDLAERGLFLQAPPICDGHYAWSEAGSRPFPAPGGFLLITAAGHWNDDCQVVQSEWSLDADITDGPFAHHHLYPLELYNAMSPTGSVDADGRVTAGNLKCVDCDEPGSEYLVYQIYRFNPGDFAELLLQESYSWSDHAPETGHVFSGFGGFNTFEWNGVLTTVAYGKNGQVVLARGTAAGQVIQEPEIVLPAVELPVFFEMIVRSFAQHDGTLLVVYKFEYQGESPFPVELVSYVIGLDGSLLHGPTPLAAYDSIPPTEFPKATWNGQFFGLCYHEPFDTFKFLLLDEDGQALKDPVSIFWDIPQIATHITSCDIIAIDDETFAVVMVVDTEDQAEYTDGAYITYIRPNPIE